MSKDFTIKRQDEVIRSMDDEISNLQSETERLRAALAQSIDNVKELLGEKAKLDEANAQLRRRLDETTKDFNTALRAYNDATFYNPELRALKAKLAWFERREQVLQPAYEALAEHAGAINEGIYVTAFQDWLEENPEPDPERVVLRDADGGISAERGVRVAGQEQACGRRTHELKVWPAYFDALADGSKTFELREAERSYRVGDNLRLREWSSVAELYTGRELTKRITYVMYGPIFGLPDGQVILSLAEGA